MNPNTMTLQECCDWLANRKGAYEGIVSHDPCGKHDYAWMDAKTNERLRGHPVPPTLDAIAAAMPEGWTLDYVRERFVEGNKWFASAYRTLLKDKLGERVCAEADTEILARARLAVACRMAEKGEQR